MNAHSSDYLNVEEEFEPVEGCNCIYCRMARMEKGVKKLESVVSELKLFLELQGQDMKPKENSQA